MKLIISQTIIKKAVACLILGVIGSLILNKAIYLHTHQLSDGTIVVHAHPFQANTDSGPGYPHHHTKCSFHYLDQLNFLYSQLPHHFALYQASYFTVHFTEKSSYYIGNFHACLKNRAPPTAFTSSHF